jgi:hypothetical protein
VLLFPAAEAVTDGEGWLSLAKIKKRLHLWKSLYSNSILFLLLLAAEAVTDGEGWLSLAKIKKDFTFGSLSTQIQYNSSCFQQPKPSPTAKAASLGLTDCLFWAFFRSSKMLQTMHRYKLFYQPEVH